MKKMRERKIMGKYENVGRKKSFDKNGPKELECILCFSVLIL